MVSVSCHSDVSATSIRTSFISYVLTNMNKNNLNLQFSEKNVKFKKRKKT